MKKAMYCPALKEPTASAPGGITSGKEHLRFSGVGDVVLKRPAGVGRGNGLTSSGCSGFKRDVEEGAT